MDDNTEDALSAFLRRARESSVFPECFRLHAKKCEINATELAKLPPEEVMRLRSIVLAKKLSEPEFRERMEGEWNECEKKIFNWVAICYAHLHGRELETLTDEQLQQLSCMTTQKPLALVRYHVCTLLRQEGRPRWSEREDRLLHEMLAVERRFRTQGEWILVSRELFLRGDLRTYKSAKHCRERWFNHVDPALTREWTPKQDRTLMETVRREGKKWAHISNQLHHAKNEHMIKNRFYSLLKKEAKRTAQEREEEELIDAILRRLKSQPAMPEEVKPIKVEERGTEHTNTRETNERESGLQLIVSEQFNIVLQDPPQQASTVFLKNLRELAIFKEENEEKEREAPEPLKMSQSLNYTLPYPSPTPVTPVSDFNLLAEASEGAFRGFKFNLYDFIGKGV